MCANQLRLETLLHEDPLRGTWNKNSPNKDGPILIPLLILSEISGEYRIVRNGNGM